MGSPTHDLTQVAEGTVMKDVPDDTAEDQSLDVKWKEDRAFVSIPVPLK